MKKVIMLSLLFMVTSNVFAVPLLTDSINQSRLVNCYVQIMEGLNNVGW